MWGVRELLTSMLATIGSVGLKEIIERDKRQIIQPSLCPRQNLELVSKVCLAAPISLFWDPCGLNELSEMHFKFLINLIGKSTNAFLTGKS